MSCWVQSPQRKREEKGGKRAGEERKKTLARCGRAHLQSQHLRGKVRKTGSLRAAWARRDPELKAKGQS